VPFQRTASWRLDHFPNNSGLGGSSQGQEDTAENAVAVHDGTDLFGVFVDDGDGIEAIFLRHINR
jgi:hypothetical protein